MKTIFTSLFAIVILTISISSCSKSDEEVAVVSVVGKWTIVQIVTSVGGAQGQTIPYVGNIAGCSKNYIEFLAGGVYRDFAYSKVNNVCTFNTEEGTWVQSGNNLIMRMGTLVDNITIKSLTATQMILIITSVISGVTYTDAISFTRI